MNFLFVAVISVILATGVFNTGPKDSEGNKKTEIIVKESSETKPTEEKVIAEAQAQAEAEAKAAAEAEEEIKEIDSSKDSGINYLKLALYIFGSILVISLGAYFYFKQGDNLVISGSNYTVLHATKYLSQSCFYEFTSSYTSLTFLLCSF